MNNDICRYVSGMAESFMENFIIIGILVLIVGASAFCVYKAKKSGKYRFGCPSGRECGGSCTSCSSQCGTCKKSEKE